MKVLYIDTSSNYLYTGVVSNGTLLNEKKVQLDKELSIFTLPKIKEMLEEVKIVPQEIDKIIVVDGPGSFTGIRIGMTIAKVYALTQKKELITISSLEAMSLSTTGYDYYIPIIDARHNYVYAGIYQNKNQVVLENQYIELNKLKKQIESLQTDHYVIITNQDIDIDGTKVAYTPDILRIVLTYQEKESINPHAAEPRYLKRTEAEESLNK